MAKWFIIAAIGIAAAVPVAAQTAQAPYGAPRTEVETQIRIPVSFRDLDLSNPTDVQILKQRLSTARRAACTAAFRDQPYAGQQINTCLARVGEVSRQKLATLLARLQMASHSGPGPGDGQHR